MVGTDIAIFYQTGSQSTLQRPPRASNEKVTQKKTLT